MVKFARWLDSADQVRRVTVLHGPEPVLMEDAIDRIKSSFGSTCEFVHWSTEQTSAEELWEIVSQNTFAARRLFIIRDADLLSYWEPVKLWLDSARLNTNSILFLSSSLDYFNFQSLEMLRRRTISVVIECCLSSEEDLVKWIKNKVKTDLTTAKYLIEKSGGSLLKISNLCRKLSLLGNRLTKEAVDVLIVEGAKENFVDSLVMLDKKTALLALSEIAVEDYPRIVGQLFARLTVVERLRSALQERAQSERELAQKLGRGYYWAARKFVPVVSRYDRRSLLNRYKALAIADDAVRQGVRDGVLEAVIALW